MSSKLRLKNILFVCTGNVCRSPMAEVLLKQQLQDPQTIVGSAGLGAAQSQPASSHATSAVKELGLDLSAHKSRPLTSDMVRAADAIFAMTHSHLDMILMLFPSASEKTFLVGEFAPKGQDGEIADPFGADLQAYRETRDQIQSAIPGIARYLQTAQAPDGLLHAHHHRVTVALGADHGGIDLKKDLAQWLVSEGYQVQDVGAFNKESVDYPDYAHHVASAVVSHRADFGILVCRSGIGMSMAANKVEGARAALVGDVAHALLAREHNDANILCLSGDDTSLEKSIEIAKTFLKTDFAGGRHETRVHKMESLHASTATHASRGKTLADTDPAISQAIRQELARQAENIELIASENFTSRAVMEAQGSCLTNKYAEGYPGKRWYGGCEFVDEVESLAIERAKKLFGAAHANVQAHSGSQANTAVYFALIKPGDKILTMNLSHGGHLTHGHPANFSGRLFDVVHYGVNQETEMIDYDQLQALALECKPKMITAGASAYSRVIDFARMRQIADSVGAYLFVDMAHIAGLVAAGVHPSPIPHAHVVTTTTHKTLRGPRGGLVLCGAELAKEIDSQIFPGIQGGPLMHVIAAKAVCFEEALQPSFTTYQRQVARNAKALCEGLKHHGFRIVSGTTENHVMLVDLQPKGLTGKEVQELLDKAGITVNKNSIPFDKQSPFKAGGIRLGSPAVTTRGFREDEMLEVADLIAKAVELRGSLEDLLSLRERVRELTSAFPLPF